MLYTKKEVEPKISCFDVIDNIKPILMQCYFDFFFFSKLLKCHIQSVNEISISNPTSNKTMKLASMVEIKYLVAPLGSLHSFSLLQALQPSSLQ